MLPAMDTWIGCCWGCRLCLVKLGSCCRLLQLPETRRQIHSQAASMNVYKALKRILLRSYCLHIIFDSLISSLLTAVKVICWSCFADSSSNLSRKSFHGNYWGRGRHFPMASSRVLCLHMQVMSGYMGRLMEVNALKMRDFRVWSASSLSREWFIKFYTVC